MLQAATRLERPRARETPKPLRLSEATMRHAGPSIRPQQLKPERRPVRLCRAALVLNSLRCHGVATLCKSERQ
jgi:hypothetical protein